MRSFYLEYSEKSNQQTIDVEKESTNLAPLVREIGGKSLPPLVAEISWSKICVITEKCKDKHETVPEKYDFRQNSQSRMNTILILSFHQAHSGRIAFFGYNTYFRPAYFCH